MTCLQSAAISTRRCQIKQQWPGGGGMAMLLVARPCPHRASHIIGEVQGVLLVVAMIMMVGWTRHVDGHGREGLSHVTRPLRWRAGTPNIPALYSPPRRLPAKSRFSNRVNGCTASVCKVSPRPCHANHCGSDRNRTASP